MLLTALLANPPSNMLCRSNMLNGHAPRCCIVDGHRRPMQSSIAAGTGGQTAHCSLPPSEPAPRSRLRQSHYPHSAQPSAASFNPASVRSHSRHRPCLRCDLTEPSRFTNRRRSDSRWQTEGRLPWAGRLRCGRTLRRARSADLPSRRRIAGRRVDCWRLQRYSTALRGKMPPRPVAWTDRRCGTG